MTANGNITRELALLLTLATLWGSAYTFIKLGVATIPPVTLIAARTLIAATVLLIVLRIRGLRLPRDAATWKRFFIQACLNTAVPFTLIAWAETTTDAGLAVILNSTTPVFAFLMTVLFIRHEPVSGRKMAGIAAGFSGIVLIVGVQALNGVGKELLAQLAVIAASVCYAGAVIFGKISGASINDACRRFASMRGRTPGTAQPHHRSPLDAVAVGNVHLCASGAFRLFHGARLRDLLPADPHTRFRRHHVTGLSAGADRCCHRRHLSR